MTIDTYMSLHRRDTSIGELENYFRSVIDWVSTTFTMVERDMCGLEWGGFTKLTIRPLTALIM